jgi:hypothetical protein
MKRILTSLAILLACLPAAAQIPHPERPLINTPDLREFLTSAHFTRTVTVDAGGRGMFKNVSDALTYVSTQTRSLSQQWTVLVYGGGSLLGTGAQMNYLETRPLVVPSFTTLKGFPGVAPSGGSINSANPTIELTATSGAQVTLSGDGAGIAGLNFFSIVTLTADAQMLRTTGPGFNIIQDTQLWGNVVTGAFGYDILRSESTFTWCLNVHTIRGQSGSAATVRNVNALSGILTLHIGRHQPAQGLGQLKTIEVNGGVLGIYWSRIVSGATSDLTVTSGTASVFHSRLANYTGTVLLDTLFSVNGTSTPATCSPGQLFVNTTGSAEKICACTAPNTWKCGNLS